MSGLAMTIFDRWIRAYEQRDEAARARRLALRRRRDTVLLAREVIGAHRRTPHASQVLIVGDEPYHWRWHRIAIHATDDLRAELRAQGATFGIARVEVDQPRGIVAFVIDRGTP